MILNPLRWPHMVLPLKRGNPFDEGNLAVFAPALNVEKVRDDAPIKIHLGNLFNFKDGPTKTYTDVDALLDDGWRVD